MSIAISDARSFALGAQTNHPFFAWENLAASATLGGTSTLTGGAASNAVNGNTHSYWLPNVTTATVSLSADFTSARTISFVGVAAHNISDYAGQVSIQYSSDNVSYFDAGAGTITPTDNSPLAFRMVSSGQSFRYWRLRITGLTSGDDIAVGVVFFGDDLVMPRPFYQGFSPILTPTEVELQSNVSVGGNYLGSSVIKRGSTLQAEWNNLAATFVRGTSWLSFQRHFNDGLPFFFGWRPAKYPQDIHYAWRQGGTIRPNNSGPKDWMNLGIDARVYES